MTTINLDDLGLKEIDNTCLKNINGGEVSPWWSVAGPLIQMGVMIMKEYANAYINYSVETGGKYVIHHAY